LLKASLTARAAHEAQGGRWSSQRAYRI
jgi:hypothetical protein